MQLSTAVRPISEVKAQAAEIIRTFSEDAAPPVVITQNGEAKAVLMGIQEYERMQETLAMLKALSLSGKSLEAGKGRPAREVFADLRRHEGRKAE
ncbi:MULTISPECIES: type II toxin-antitoxin system Phd/YefM family antitoxin [unclassified Desulfovibrio]|uniref:type II toxin-antitoxin system Phd/YefM family antitoxin n=1 Tax=unclassified Desulfovibrio TaxID=2593640 RepID=UPI002FD92126